MIFLSSGTNGEDRSNGRKPFDDFTPIIVVRARDCYDLVVKSDLFLLSPYPLTPPRLSLSLSLFLPFFVTSGNNFLDSINPILWNDELWYEGGLGAVQRHFREPANRICCASTAENALFSRSCPSLIGCNARAINPAGPRTEMISMLLETVALRPLHLVSYVRY